MVSKKSKGYILTGGGFLGFLMLGSVNGAPDWLWLLLVLASLGVFAYGLRILKEQGSIIPRIVLGIFHFVFNAMLFITQVFEKASGMVQVYSCYWDSGYCVCETDEGEVIFDPISGYVHKNETSIINSRIATEFKRFCD